MDKVEEYDYRKDWGRYDPDSPLDSRVSFCLWSRLWARVDEVREWLRVHKHTDGGILDELRPLARNLISSIQNLGKGLPLDEPQVLADALRAHARLNKNHDQLADRILIEVIGGELGLQSVAQLQIAESRIWKLLPLAESMLSSQTALDYLKRVSRCYLFGFDPECVIMCRSVLDAAFSEFIRTKDRIDDYSERNTGYTLEQSIALAEINKWLSDDLIRLAHSTRQIANNVVHHRPAFPTARGAPPADPIVVIENTLRVVMALADGA